MNVSYSDGVKQLGEVYELAQKATARLDEILGPEASTATAEWDRTQDDKGGTLLTLRLRDPIGEVDARMWPDELRSVALTDVRLHVLWNKLGMLQLKKMVNELSAHGGVL